MSAENLESITVTEIRRSQFKVSQKLNSNNPFKITRYGKTIGNHNEQRSLSKYEIKG